MARAAAALLSAAAGAAAESPYLVGVAKADATGPITQQQLLGMSKAGQNAAGLHTRLYARAFVVAEPGDGGARVAFVSVDNGFVGAAMRQEAVARLAARFPDGRYTARNVMISSTHNHAGPGGHLDYFLFQFTCKGFNNQTFEAYTQGVVDAVVKADAALQPGSISSSTTTLKEGSNINRSPTSYLQNPEEERARYPDGDTDRGMVQLQFDAADGTPLGVFNWFAIHGTVLNNTNTLVSGDSRGLASQRLEQAMDSSGALPGDEAFVAGFAATNLGDVSPNTDGMKCHLGPDSGKSCDITTSTCPQANPLPLPDAVTCAATFFESCSESMGHTLKCLSCERANKAALAAAGCTTVIKTAFCATPSVQCAEALVRHCALSLLNATQCNACVKANEADLTAAGCGSTGEAEFCDVPSLIPGLIPSGPPAPAPPPEIVQRNEGCWMLGPGKDGDIFKSNAIMAQKQVDASMQMIKGTNKTQLSGVVHSVHQYINMSGYKVRSGGRTCAAAMKYSFAGGTVDGPGAFDFHQHMLKGEPVWDVLSQDVLAPLLSWLGGHAKPTQDDYDCHAPGPVLLFTGFYRFPWQWHPDIVELQLFRIGDLVIVAVPSEFTTMSGRRMRESIHAALVAQGVPASAQVVIAGLSNQYTHYTATEEEYAHQRYEGASTIFGPKTLAAYMQAFGDMVPDLVNGTVPPEGTPQQMSPFFKKTQLTGAPGVDYLPPGTSCGDVITDALPSYSALTEDTFVRFSFHAANPRHDMHLGKTYFVVERQGDSGAWTAVANDNSETTRMEWQAFDVNGSEIVTSASSPGWREYQPGDDAASPTRHLWGPMLHTLGEMTGSRVDLGRVERCVKDGRRVAIGRATGNSTHCGSSDVMVAHPLAIPSTDCLESFALTCGLQLLAPGANFTEKCQACVQKNDANLTGAGCTPATLTAICAPPSVKCAEALVLSCAISGDAFDDDKCHQCLKDSAGDLTDAGCTGAQEAEFCATFQPAKARNVVTVSWQPAAPGTPPAAGGMYRIRYAAEYMNEAKELVPFTATSRVFTVAS